MPVGRPEPVVYPVSPFERFDPRTWGLLASVALAGLLLAALAFSVVTDGGESPTAAGPGVVTMPAEASSGSPDPSPSDPTALGQSTLAVESSTTSAPSTTTAPSTTSTTAVPTTSPATVVTTAAPSTVSTTTMAPTTVASSSTETSTTETMASSTTVAPPSTTAAPTTTPTTAGPSGGDAVVQQQVLDATNAERAANGCGPLRMDPLLNQAADGHSEDMAARGYFDHNDPEGRGPAARIDAVNYPRQGWGENIAAGYGSAEAVVAGWMNSSGHRANILNCAFDEIGIGYAESGRYWTQLFATRR